MANANDIYRRFVEAPLRLKTRTPSPSPPSTPPPSTQQYDASKRSPWDDSPAFSTRSKEVKKLRRKVAKLKLGAADAQIPRDLDDATQEREVSDTESSAGASSADAATLKVAVESGANSSGTVLRKKKRVTRAVSIKNEDTGAHFVDTPTKASKPPKRFRRFSRDLSPGTNTGSSKEEGKTTTGKVNHNIFSFNWDEMETRDEKYKEGGSVATAESSSAPRRRMSVTVTLPLRRSRRLQHVKPESPKLPTIEKQSQKTKVSSDTPTAPATPPPAEASESVVTTSADSVPEPAEIPVLVDLISPFCDSLLETDTISGCFFALSLNALRGLRGPLILKSTSSEANPLESVFTICIGIAECEKSAQRSFPSKSPKMKSPKSPKPANLELPGKRRRSSGKIMLMKGKKVKKSVRFRSFDLSCLNLQYVGDEQVAIMVDKILTRYRMIMEHIETIVSQFDAESDTPVQAVLRELSSVMAISPYSTSQSDTDTADDYKRIYRRAYGGRDPYSQHEIRICGEYFAHQFANLLLPRASPSAPPLFLQRVFSSLASSSVRFKLRVLFIESEDFGEDVSGGGELQSRELLDENGKPFPAMAPYEHQDLGAAIHWALQESVMYWSLAQPLYEMLGRDEDNSGNLDEDSPVKACLDENAAEDLDHMEKYVLARRFLRFHLTKSWYHRSKGDGDAAETWASIEKVCSLAKRFHFEDETHLYPLASVDEFVTLLASEEPTLHRMEKVLQAFYEQKYGTSLLQPEPCMECHHLITREENPTSIRCTSCARRFHLGCLHLPESFTQYAEHYTCPACFLGRGGY